MSLECVSMILPSAATPRLSYRLLALTLYCLQRNDYELDVSNGDLGIVGQMLKANREVGPCGRRGASCALKDLNSSQGLVFSICLHTFYETVHLRS